MKMITLGTSHGDPTRTRFNTSTLLEINHTYYLLDAGAPVAALLIRRGIDLNLLRAIFITHMHEDHFGGLSGIIKNQAKRMTPPNHTTIYLPEAEAIAPLKNFINLAHRPVPSTLVSYQAITPGNFFSDGTLELEAIPTRHFENEHLHYPSFGFLVHSKGVSRVLYTGDLKADFSDFPVRYCDKNTVCFCELTHYSLEKALPVLAKLDLKRLIFNHIGNFWQSEEGEMRLNELKQSLPYEVLLSHDGEEFEI
ncbi:MAG: MBL fold metallo-hydrolase [Victivallaceae bacterium]|nr:MBL fold metallo-hydrolase [Victivallaceae bacterium]